MQKLKRIGIADAKKKKNLQSQFQKKKNKLHSHKVKIIQVILGKIGWKLAFDPHFPPPIAHAKNKKNLHYPSKNQK